MIRINVIHLVFKVIGCIYTFLWGFFALSLCFRLFCFLFYLSAFSCVGFF
jgi:hypothetical protein